MLSQFKKHIEKEFSDFRNKEIGVAISGGVDSVVLAYILYHNKFSITLLHCNFNLRNSASDGDQAFVENLAQNWNIPFLTIDFDTKSYAKKNKTSIQISARELRYDWFTKMANQHNLNTVVTAHHADDNLETILINLSRGTGLEGLTGIPQINGLYSRPLLPFSKEQILSFAKENNLEWREDISNADTKYVRNKIRHQMIPAYKEVQPQLLNNITNTVKYLQQSQHLVNTYIQKKQQSFLEQGSDKNSFQLSIEKLKQEPHIDLVLFETLKEYGFNAWNDIKNLLNAQSGKKVISATHTLLKNREYLLLYKTLPIEVNKSFKIEEKDQKLNIKSGILHIENAASISNLDHKILSSIQIDKDLLDFPLVVRKWQKGDYFYPVGMQGKKKLSKYFKDEKFSIPDKESTWLLCSKNEIIWVISKRVDRRFQITSKTTNSLTITYEINK